MRINVKKRAAKSNCTLLVCCLAQVKSLFSVDFKARTGYDEMLLCIPPEKTPAFFAAGNVTKSGKNESIVQTELQVSQLINLYCGNLKTITV